MIKTSFQLFLLMKIEFSLVNIDQIMRAPYGGVFVEKLDVGQVKNWPH